MNFFVGFHHPGRGDQVGRPLMLSANALRGRKSDIDVGDWMLDSGAFTQVSNEAGFHETPAEYAITVARWARCGNLVAASTQDYMCEPEILYRMSTNAKAQQERTLERYRSICRYLRRIGCTTHLLPVLQGWTPEHYRRHLEMYELESEAWVGAGSICKRNGSPADVERVLSTIKDARPDLRLHAFGLKRTALQRPSIREMLYSADSMAWSYAARKQGRDPNDPAEARRFYDELNGERERTPLFA